MGYNKKMMKEALANINDSAKEKKEYVIDTNLLEESRKLIAEYRTNAENCIDNAKKANYYFKAAKLGDTDSIYQYAKLTSYIYEDVDVKTTKRYTKEIIKVRKKLNKVNDLQKKESLLAKLLKENCPYAHYLIGKEYYSQKILIKC